MRLPVIAYGDPVLRKKAADIDSDHPALSDLIDNMFETMYGANGVGLAAPQVGKSIRLFIVDATPYADDDVVLASFKKVFINARVIEETGDKWDFNEGCLSIPDIREDVSRRDTVTLSYYDEKWNKHEETFSGLAARIIQHEYDHIEGKLFTDKLSPLRRAMLKSRLESISKGNVKVEYKMKFPALKTGKKR
ncbi:MAG TPA: peptide deformylase [Sphingobacteriaceae bacterium]|nr:peptide deformylase [Sphingobacteriaceae bacterium]